MDMRADSHVSVRRIKELYFWWFLVVHSVYGAGTGPVLLYETRGANFKK